LFRVFSEAFTETLPEDFDGVVRGVWQEAFRLLLGGIGNPVLRTQTAVQQQSALWIDLRETLAITLPKPVEWHDLYCTAKCRFAKQ